MNPNLLQQAIADAKAVRNTALNNAKQALEDAFGGKFQQVFNANTTGYSTTEMGEGIVRYSYEKECYETVKKTIEDNGCLILDENEEDGWIDTIKPETLATNINQEDLYSEMSKELANEIDKDILDQLVKSTNEQRDEFRKLRRRYTDFKRYLKQPPWPVDEDQIPTFEEWLKHEGKENFINNPMVANDRGGAQPPITGAYYATTSSYVLTASYSTTAMNSGFVYAPYIPLIQTSEI